MADWLHEDNHVAVDHVRNRKTEAAIVEFRRILNVDPGSCQIWSNLSAALWSLRRYDEAMDAVKRALAIDPAHGLALSNLGMIYVGIGEHELAERAFDEALQHEPGLAKARWNRSMYRLGRKEYASGFEEYDVRFDCNLRDYPQMPLPYWRGQDLTGKGIHVEVEQGVGDTVFFARFLPWLAKQAEWVTLCAAPRVVQLLWGYREVVDFYPQFVPFPPVDYGVYLGSLPKLYGVGLDNIPPDPGYIRSHALAMGDMVKLEPEPTSSPAYRIGICWTGNPEMERNDERTIPLQYFSELARDPRVWLYSLQAGPMEADIKAQGLERLIVDLGPQLRAKGFLGTATAILQCDLVITCCTSVAHLAGALGVEAWVLLCRDPYWIWGHDDSQSSPWYPSLRLFRQPMPGDWESVFAHVRAELAQLLSLEKGV